MMEKILFVDDSKAQNLVPCCFFRLVKTHTRCDPEPFLGFNSCLSTLECKERNIWRSLLQPAVPLDVHAPGLSNELPAVHHGIGI